MTREIEESAKAFLLNRFLHSRYRFENKAIGDVGFDLWLIETGNLPKKVELKATENIYHRPSNLFEGLVFNAEIEKVLFESGESVIARVFLGSDPIRVFIMTNSILSLGATLRREARYVIRGDINYDDSHFEIK